MGLHSRLRSDLLEARMALRMLTIFVRFRPGARWSPARLLEENADRLPHRPSLRFLDESQTWRELDQTANRWAHHLASRGVGAGDVVALLGPPS